MRDLLRFRGPTCTISQPTYRRLENGTRALKGDELVILADLFGVRAAAISGLSGVRQRARFAARTDGTAAIGEIFGFAHEAAHFDVFSMGAYDSEYGLSMLDPGSGQVVIAVATMENPMRQRSSVAHEPCHVLAGDLGRSSSDRPGLRPPEEVRADAFARHLLPPRDALRFGDGYAVSDGDLSTLV